MSSWTCLNIEGVLPAQIPDVFDDWHKFEEDGRTVMYTFRRKMEPEDIVAKIAEVGDHPVEPVVERVLYIQGNDTSDFFRCTMYYPRDVKWNGMEKGLTTTGHHYSKDNSEFLDKLRSEVDYRPNLGGNYAWQSEE